MSDALKAVDDARESRYAEVLGIVESPTEDTPTEQPEAAVAVEPEETEEPQPESSEGEEVESPETEPAPDTGTEEKEQKGKHRFSKRIDELIKQRNLTRAENQELRQKLEQIQRDNPKPEDSPKLAVPDDAPKREDFPSDEAWVDARADWRIAQRDKTAADQKRLERDTYVRATYLERADKFATEHPDFNDAVKSVRFGNMDIVPGVQAAIMGRPNGPEVAYYLSQHPEIIDELDEMNAADAVAEIGAISVSLKGSTTVPSPKPATRVPAPITPVGGSTRVARELGELDPDAYIAERRKQRAAARAR